MTKQEKIASLATAMIKKTRDDGEEFYCFADNASRELIDLFLEHYEVKDIDYETFSRACDIVAQVYADKPTITQDDATDEICERAGDSGSVYTYDRLQYLDANNEHEITDMLKSYGLSVISEACAAWYDNQVENQAMIINEWVNA